MTDPLEEITYPLRERLGTWIYCERCKHLEAMLLKGREREHPRRVVYECTPECGNEVRINVAWSWKSKARVEWQKPPGDGEAKEA